MQKCCSLLFTSVVAGWTDSCVVGMNFVVWGKQSGLCLATVVNSKIKALTLSRFYVSLKWLSTRCTESQFKNVCNNYLFLSKNIVEVSGLLRDTMVPYAISMWKPWGELLTHSVL